MTEANGEGRRLITETQRLHRPKVGAVNSMLMMSVDTWTEADIGRLSAPVGMV